MKKTALLVLLLFLVSCAPREPVQPVVQQVVVPPVELVVQQTVVPPVVQKDSEVVVNPSDTIEKIEIKAESGDPKTVNVDIVGFRYEPAQVKVKVGDTVVWTQVDEIKHTVTIVSGPETFDSGLLKAGQTFSHTFTIPGEYSYKCTPHPNMRGKVIVE